MSPHFLFEMNELGIVRVEGKVCGLWGGMGERSGISNHFLV